MRIITMARSRNIKPSFFSNDLLAEVDPLGRLLFVGLWTLADYKGELEWRSKRVKAQLLPYDECDIDDLARNLSEFGFIKFYSDGEKIYLKIENFCKHQNPHKNERDKGSEIPEFNESMAQTIDLKGLTINRDKSRLNHDENETNPADSLNLIPDSLEPNMCDKSHALEKKDIEKGFEYFWKKWRELKIQVNGSFGVKKEALTQWYKLFKNHEKQAFKIEVDAICKHAAQKLSTEYAGNFNDHINLHAVRFLKREEWK